MRRHMRLTLHIGESGTNTAPYRPSGLPGGEDNLVTRAAVLLGQRIGMVDPYGQQVGSTAPVTRLQLEKRIPIAAGMAGGSTDAAAALVLLNQLWDCRLDLDELRDLGAEVGSDVPFCVVGGTALAAGRGTRLVRVLCRGTFHWVIGCSRQPLFTPTVYRAWDDHCEPSRVEPDAVLAALSAGDAEALGGALFNDLQEAAFVLRPELAGKRSALLAAGALGAVVSGSGPTLLGLARGAEDASRLARAVEGHFDDVYVARSPAGGPEVMR